MVIVVLHRNLTRDTGCAHRLFQSVECPCLTSGEQAVDDTGQVAGHRLNGFGAAQPGTKVPVTGAEITVAAQQ